MDKLAITYVSQFISDLEKFKVSLEQSSLNQNLNEKVDKLKKIYKNAMNLLRGNQEKDVENYNKQIEAIVNNLDTFPVFMETSYLNNEVAKIIQISRTAIEQPFEKLPVEIIKKIFDYLTNEELKNISMTNRGLWNQAESHLVERINNKKIPITNIFNKKQVAGFIERNGERITYLGFCGGYEIEEINKLMIDCPNLKHLLINSCKIYNWGALSVSQLIEL